MAMIILLMPFYSCIRAQKLSEPEANFEHLWKAYDKGYAIFGPKQINWDAIYNVYRPQVTSETNDDKLFEIMSNMIGHLNDNHVSLRSANPTRQYSAGYLQQLFFDKVLELAISLINTAKL